MGSWIVDHLAQQGHEVFILSRRGQPPVSSAPALPHYTYTPVSIQADLTTLSAPELAALLPENLHGCVHAASCNESFVQGYAHKALQVNGFGTRNLLESLVLHAKNTNTPPPVTVYCSTFHVYGIHEGCIDEQTPAAPCNDYALTHLVGEEYCRFFGRTHELPYIIVRSTNGYGAPLVADFDKWYLILNDLCRSAMQNGKITLRSNPSVIRDFIWMGDVAAAIGLLLERRDLAGTLFNLASGQSTSIGHIATLAAQTASRYTGKAIPVEMLTPPVAVLPLTVSNKALCVATGMVMQQRMEQEMLATLDFFTRHEVSHV